MGKKLLVPDEFLLRYSILRLIAAHKKTLNIREARRRRWEKKYDEWWSKDSENASDYLWWQHSLADVPFRWKTGGWEKDECRPLLQTEWRGESDGPIGHPDGRRWAVQTETRHCRLILTGRSSWKVHNQLTHDFVFRAVINLKRATSVVGHFKLADARNRILISLKD